MIIRYIPIPIISFNQQLLFLTTTAATISSPLARVEASVPTVKHTNYNDSSKSHTCISNALKISAKMGNLYEGKQIHANIINLGMTNVLSLGNQLLHVYVKCKEFADACKLFDEMCVRNVVTWNTLICGLRYSTERFNANVHLGFHYFKQMLMESVPPDCITFCGLLQLCVELKDGFWLGKMLHCAIVKLGYDQSCFLCANLVDLYGKFGLVGEARCVLDGVLARDLVLWNVMISCYVLNVLGEEAFCLFNLMRLKGVEGDEFTFASLLNSCASLGFYDLGRQIQGLAVKICLNMDVVVESALVDMYAKNEHITDARKVFDAMAFRNVVSWNTIIVGYGRRGDGKEAIELLRRMLREDFVPDELTLASVLSSCGNLSMATEIVQVHAYAVKYGFSNSLSIGNALINAYSKCGSIAHAYQSFSSIKAPDLVSWTSMIGAYASHGFSKEAIQLFDKMLVNDVKPDGIVFLEVLSACSHGGLFCKGLQYFSLMTNHYQIMPSSEHYTCIVDLFGRLGLLNEAYEVVNSMPVESQADALKAFIGTCNIHGNMKLAKWAAEKLFVIDPNDTATYVLMSNLYASDSNWLDAAFIWKMARERLHNKSPGCSVEIAGGFNTLA
ncbi:PREDICTED: pentatricopeptide repeat-containing protein At2g46050, mitochondrial [Nicotiana attenuata]|uniref:Pentatricopeptide repeat-containing protein, mitochondrial n=1 Tax=Nicotiana attenuata TaxID=49451 RepID=A0A1J6J3T9_NICAT|nr:PREDICTED: pentatricopeptide repeat-containing protein At2g46050, mitochondrial [Nicotiana attenuata]OIT07352.1 pentatricopeptide repeat-containing protein, mitochondrial [Nicotiana attenuata]